MTTFLRSFWREEEGQDLIEYTLLLAFIAIASAAILTSTGNSIRGIWTTTQANLDNAASQIP